MVHIAKMPLLGFLLMSRVAPINVRALCKLSSQKAHGLCCRISHMELQIWPLQMHPFNACTLQLKNVILTSFDVAVDEDMGSEVSLKTLDH